MSILLNLKKRPKKSSKSNGLKKQAKINKSKKSKKTWTPAHRKMQKHRKKHSVLQASKTNPGHKRENHHTESKVKIHQSLYNIIRRDNIQ